MKYSQFDKDFTPRQIYNEILCILEESPRGREDIHNAINAPKTKVNRQLGKLMHNNLVDKKFFDGAWFYGLTLKYREELQALEKEKIIKTRNITR